jgi:hypothetical protein
LDTARQQLQDFAPVETSTVLHAFEACLYQQWQNCPQNPRDGDGIYGTYERWFGKPVLLVRVLTSCLVTLNPGVHSMFFRQLV